MIPPEKLGPDGVCPHGWWDYCVHCEDTVDGCGFHATPEPPAPQPAPQGERDLLQAERDELHAGLLQVWVAAIAAMEFDGVIVADKQYTTEFVVSSVKSVLARLLQRAKEAESALAAATARAEKAEVERDQWQAIFDKQREREKPYVELWRLREGKPLSLPDYGSMLEFLIEMIDLTDEVNRQLGEQLKAATAPTPDPNTPLTEAHARGRREAAAIAEIYREALLGKRTGECPCCGVKDGDHDPICELVPAEEYMEALAAQEAGHEQG